MEPIFPSDAPSVLTGSWGLVCLMNKAPHSNAAKLFINWLAGPQAEEVFAKSTQSLSLRTDVPSDGLPSLSSRKRASNTWTPTRTSSSRTTADTALAKVRELLGE